MTEIIVNRLLPSCPRLPAKHVFAYEIYSAIVFGAVAECYVGLWIGRLGKLVLAHKSFFKPVNKSSQCSSLKERAGTESKLKFCQPLQK